MTEKILALNVPTNFLAHVDFARESIMLGPRQRSFERDPNGWALGRYDRCLRILNSEPDAHVAMRLLEIECRFVALLRTVDQSIPVAPLFKRYGSIHRTTRRHTDTDIADDYVVQSLGYKTAQQVPHTIEDFRRATTLAEKALIADLMLRDFSQAVGEIAEHFDYKRGMFGRGASRTYSLAYGVLALAIEFESHNEAGRAAGVTLSADGRRHEGLFLDFILAFIFVVDAGTIGLRPTDGFNERVRKIAQKRAVDLELVGLLDQADVDADTMLDFLARIDALK